MVTNAVTLLFLLGFTAALAPHRALRSPSLSTPNGFLSNHRLREATVVLATDDETAVEEETAAVEGEAAPSIISALNPFSTTSSAEARVARQEAEMGGALPETILSTTGIKERLSQWPNFDIQWVAGHVGLPENERADALAVAGCENRSLPA